MSRTDREATKAAQRKDREQEEIETVQGRQEARARKLQEQEAREVQIAAKKAKPTIKEVVRELLPDAVATESASGLPFGVRRLVYRIRDRVLRRTGKELVQSTFDKLLTEIEAEQGDLSPLLYREARGSFYLPHKAGDAMPLGTLTVRRFKRPPGASTRSC